MDRFGILLFDIVVDWLGFSGHGKAVSCLPSALELLRSAATTPEGHVDRRGDEDLMEDNLDLPLLPLGFGLEAKVSSDLFVISSRGSTDMVAV